jgi:hypothetical protein
MLAEATDGRLTVVHNDILDVDLRTMQVLQGHLPRSTGLRAQSPHSRADTGTFILHVGAGESRSARVRGGAA